MDYDLKRETGNGEKSGFTFPSNVKQMGNIDKKLKIYIEDYAYTYLYQYAKTGGGSEKLAVLVGSHTYINDCDVIIISGAIQGRFSVNENGAQTFTDESWLYINEQIRKFFDGLSIIGWVHVQPEFGIFMMSRDETFHKRCFKNSYQVFCTLDPAEKQECFYTYNEDMSSLRPVKGYFIYYDKNERMQDYMLENSISKPKEPINDEGIENEDEPMSALADVPEAEKEIDRIDAASRIRKVLNGKEETKAKARQGRYMAFTAVSGVLCAAFIFMCVSMVQNMGRIKALEAELTDVKFTYSDINSKIEDTAAQVFAVKTMEQEKEQREKEAAEAEAKKLEEEKQNQETGDKYIIQYGDTLWDICNRHYGSPEMLTTVMAVNNLTDKDKLWVGQEITLP